MRRSIRAIKKDLAQAQKDIDAMTRIMSNCYSDDAYRNYSKSLNGFIADKVRLSRELEEVQAAKACCGKGPYVD